jgi:DNA-binding GntR family transcriptional regulator
VAKADGARPDTEALRLYRQLKHDILARVYAPGQPLAEIELARQYGASRTPLREALHRLDGDGLVRIEPRRGAFVQELTVTDFLEINELRAVLEPYAARLAAVRLVPEEIVRLRSELAQIDVDQPTEDDFRRLEALDGEVHAAIARASGNTRLRRLIQSLDDMMQVMRVGDMRQRHGETHDSLTAILTALQERDADAAEALLRRHITDFRGAIASQGWQPLAGG